MTFILVKIKIQVLQQLSIVVKGQHPCFVLQNQMSPPSSVISSTIPARIITSLPTISSPGLKMSLNTSKLRNILIIYQPKQAPSLQNLLIQSYTSNRDIYWPEISDI